MSLALLSLWEWVKKTAVFLKDHWYIPLFLAGAALGYFFTQKYNRGPPLAQTKAELDAIAAAGKVREVEAKAGVEAAKAHVQEAYKEQLAALNERQKAEAKTYESNPQELARFLVRIGGPAPHN